MVVNCELRVPRKMMWMAGDVMPVACQNFWFEQSRIVDGYSMWDLRTGTKENPEKKILPSKNGLLFSKTVIY